MKKGLISDIQRFSLNDGPGIRTTVFFKGCNMHCDWCHNPETISLKKEIMLYASKCIGCGRCFSVCPVGAHKVEGEKHIVDRDVCTLCGKCVEGCYTEALVFSAKELDTDEILKEILEDKVYYDESKGGVTLSGGEVSCQSEFAINLAQKCRENGISVAIETNLLTSFDKLRPLLEAVDLVMLDIKIFDDDKHRLHTGVSNQNILKNIKKLDEMGIPYIVRTPLIPFVTDSKENVEAIADFLSGLKNLSYYELLNFNPLGASKYDALDRENKYESFKPFGADRLAELTEALKKYPIKVKVGG